ncbi:hypothetical protein [Sphingobium sp. MP9-4]|jgi:hypothetical protein|uniref:hypothetical protein n=1 Tax=Sphingobium sp. MP9-4 TaxID=1761936 RepID=UPI0010CA7CB9|nr:hypothetical protein [Sphingobium sp. MP9-4]
MTTFAYGEIAAAVLRDALAKLPRNKSLRGDVDWDYTNGSWRHCSYATGKEALQRGGEQYGLRLNRVGANMLVYDPEDLAAAKKRMHKHVITHGDPRSPQMKFFVHNPSREVVRRVLEMDPETAGITMGFNGTIGSACFIVKPTWLDDTALSTMMATRAHSGRNYRTHCMDSCFDRLNAKTVESRTSKAA